MITAIIKKYKSKLILSTLFSALSSIVSISLLATINDKITVNSVDEIIAVAPTFLLLLCLLFTVSLLSQFLLAKLGSSFIYQLRSTLLKRTINANFENLEREGSHKVLATITTDVTNIAHSLAVLPVFAVNLATIIFCLSYLGIQSVQLFGFLLIGLFIGVVSSILIMKKGRKYFFELREKEDNLFNIFKTLIDGSKELSINQNRRKFFYSKQAVPSIEQMRHTEVRAKGYWILSESIFNSLLFLILGFLLFVAHLLLSIDNKTLTSFIIFTTYLVGPIAFIQGTTQMLIKGRISYKKISSLKLSEKSSESAQCNLLPSADWKVLTFNNVKYTYQNNRDYKFSIGPINLSVFKGDNIFICGGNGSGKSTFAKLLVGLYEPQQGGITFSNVAIDNDNIQWYRNHFSTIFSDFHLFDHILDSNGALIKKTDMLEHLKKLQLLDKVDITDGKISTTKLSQGQRKRLAMLLAYAEDAPIYLFDEWAADQDPAFREYFYTELLPEFKKNGKTLIVITHDDKYYHLADRLLEFDSGNFCERDISQKTYDAKSI